MMSLGIHNLRDVLLRVAYLYQHAPEELKGEYEKVARIFIEKGKRIVEQYEREKAAAPPQEPPTPPGAEAIQSTVPGIARELWALARGNPDVFTAYARSYPNEELQRIAANPAQLNLLMNQINNTQTEVLGSPVDGIPQAPLKSSNIFGTRYDRLQKSLRVRFQDGSVYKYSGVPEIVNDLFAKGAGTCRTSGRNKHGFWFKNKNPSMGAAFYNLIKLGRYPYQKIK